MVKIKNWGKFQHYKNRRPPWIKFHVETLEDRAIMLLAPFDYRVLTLCWLINSKTGKLPNLSDLAFQLRITEKELTKSLQSLKDFIEVDDSTTLAGCSQVAPESSPETETETETETEKPLVHPKPDAPNDRESFEIVWLRYPEKKGKEKAWLKFKNQVKTWADYENIQIAIDNYMQDVKQIRANGHPDRAWQNGSTWFNNEWRDYINYKPPPSTNKWDNVIPEEIPDDL